MATHAQIEAWWADYRCNTDDLAYLDMNGRYPMKMQAVLEDASVALSDAIMASGYRTPMGPSGSYNCRKIGGSDTWSLHAYAVAVDWDYGENPYLRGTQIQKGFVSDPRFLLTEANVNAVEAIVNVNGDPIWRWLGWTIGDTMHFQVDVPPEQCQPVQEDDMQWADIVADATWAKAYEDGFIQGDPSVMPQYYFEGGPASEDEKKNGYNVIMREQMDRT